MVDPVGPDFDLDVGGNPEAEEVRHNGFDRLDGELIVTNRRLLVGAGAERMVGEASSEDLAADEAGAGDPDVVAVPLESVSELTGKSIDWFQFLMGIAIVGFGVLSIERTVIGGLAFLVVGFLSLAWTWRRRGRVRIRMHSRPKPIDTYPVHQKAFLDTMDEVLAPVRAKRPPEGGSVGLQ